MRHELTRIIFSLCIMLCALCIGCKNPWLEDTDKYHNPQTGDTTAPVVSGGTITRTSDTAATIGFTTDEAGTAYYLVVEKDAAAPTSAEVKAGTSLGAVTAGENTGKSITLTAGEKDIYVVVEDAAGNISKPLKIAAATFGASVGPVLSDGSAVRTNEATATISFTTSEAGTAYYLVVAESAAAPTSAQVKAGTLLGAVTAGANTGKSVNADTSVEKVKHIYVVVEDAAGNISEPLLIVVSYPYWWYLKHNATPGDVTQTPVSGTVFTISNKQEMFEFAKVVNNQAVSEGGPNSARNFNGQTVQLANNINLNNEEWTPIGNTSGNRFRGTFDGKNKNITNLKINNTDSTVFARGLFGILFGNIKDLNVSGNIKSAGAQSGGVVGDFSGEMTNVHFSGSIEATSYVGGLIGIINESTITACSNSANINATSRVGGIVGQLNDSASIIENCHNTGNIDAGDNTGGIAGSSFGTINFCYNTGNIDAGNNTGGIVGSSSGTIKNSYNTGNINGGNSLGGISGFNSNDTIEFCYNTGNITGGSSLGGIVGNSTGTIKDSYNTGNISGNDLSGGISGTNGGYGSVINCYNTGNVNVSGSAYAGGIVGNYGSGSNCTVQDCVSLGLQVSNSNPSAGYIVGRIQGIANSAHVGVNVTFTNNKARSDMTGAMFSNKSAAQNDGLDITVGAGTTQASVFDTWDFSTVWQAGDTNLVGGAKLPTLRGVGGTQNPVLP